MSGSPDSNAREAVAAPAILLMIVAIMGVLFSLLVIVATGEGVVQWLADNPNVPPDLREQLLNTPRDATSSRLFYAFQALLSAVVFLGALKMKSLQSYGLAMAGAIAACLPCCGPCFGCLSLPLGVWALILLTRQEVKQAFH